MSRYLLTYLIFDIKAALVKIANRWPAPLFHDNDVTNNCNQMRHDKS